MRFVEARLANLTDEALELGARDASYFAELIVAMRLPHDDARGSEERGQALNDTTQALRSNTVCLLAVCDDAEAQLHSIADQVDEVMAGDVFAASALINAARSIHAANLADSKSREG